jgi:multidrug efflux pump subunit AcrB
VPASDDAHSVFGRLTFTVFLVVILLIAGVLIAQRIPHAARPYFRHPVSTVTVTQTPPH